MRKWTKKEIRKWESGLEARACMWNVEKIWESKRECVYSWDRDSVLRNEKLWESSQNVNKVC